MSPHEYTKSGAVTEAVVALIRDGCARSERRQGWWILLYKAALKAPGLAVRGRCMWFQRMSGLQRLATASVSRMVLLQVLQAELAIDESRCIASSLATGKVALRSRDAEPVGCAGVRIYSNGFDIHLRMLGRSVSSRRLFHSGRSSEQFGLLRDGS